jgi:hypothetical protein
MEMLHEKKKICYIILLQIETQMSMSTLSDTHRRKIKFKLEDSLEI